MEDCDPLEALLQVRPPGEESAALRQRLLTQTTGVLRRRRRLKRLSLGAALAACFLAGAAATWFLKPPTVVHDPPDQVAAPKPEPRKDDLPKADQVPAPPSPLAQEWRAFDAAAHRARLFREAGDRYLNDFHDVEAALRCYRQALDAGGDDALTISPADTWLLIALKDARKKEKSHAIAGG